MLKNRLAALFLGAAVAVTIVAGDEFEGIKIMLIWVFPEYVMTTPIASNWGTTKLMRHGLNYCNRSSRQCQRLQTAVKVPITEPMKSTQASFAYKGRT
jgi:hypothetical protein